MPLGDAITTNAYAYCTLRILKLQKSYLGDLFAGIRFVMLCTVLCGCAAGSPPPASIQATATPPASSPATAGIPTQAGTPTTAAPTIEPATPVPISWCIDLPAEPPEA